MILIDQRERHVNRREATLIKAIIDGAGPLPVEYMDLPSADYAFEGNGPDGKRIFVGIEYKRVRGMMESIRYSGRFSANQAPNMSDLYQRRYLIVEGIYRPNPIDGVLEEYFGNKWVPLKLNTNSSSFMYSELDKYLTTMAEFGGIAVKRTSTADETAKVILNLYHWWNDKEYDKHRAHLGFWTELPKFVQMMKPTFEQRVAKECYKIGWEKATAVVGYFHTGRNMANAEVSDWLKVAGIGKTLALKIWQEWNGIKP